MAEFAFGYKSTWQGEQCVKPHLACTATVFTVFGCSRAS